MAEVDNSPPLEIDPYETLEIESTATTAEVKSAYKKLALHNHPDKVPHDERDSAHTRFQAIAFAYAILSDDRRRKRYDTTGNTAETLDIDDDDFNWLDFFRAQWADTVTSEKISDFAGRYKGSDEERKDVLNAYQKSKGDLNKLFKEVMLCNVLDDEERFRLMIDEAIEGGEVEKYDAYVNEPESKKKSRRRNAERQAEEAEKHAKDLGLNGHKKPGKKGKEGREDDLAAMIQQRQKGRAANFLDDLEAKYAAPKAKKGKKRQSEEPPEEAFQQMGKKAKTSKKQVIVEDDEEDDVDLDGDDFDDDHDDEEEDEDEEEKVKPLKARKGASKSTSGTKGSKAMNGKKRSTRHKG